jgi:hypothetical protein
LGCKKSVGCKENMTDSKMMEPKEPNRR